MNKIGFACKWIDSNQEIVERSNCKTITRSWADRQTDEVIYMKLAAVASHNIDSIQHMCDNVHKLPVRLQMFRISSEILPLYTIRRYAEMYRQMPFISERLMEVGNYIRALGVVVSFHPGQFCCLASEHDHVVKNSVDEIEYHADMARMMGFGRSFQDGCKINIHISGKLGPQAFLQRYRGLTKTAQNLLTIENEEMTYGLDAVLSISHVVPVVLDIHHHWIKSGEYIQPNDIRVNMVIDSWRGKTPTLHYSVSREDVLVDHPIDELPNLETLLSNGFKKMKLRAHSEYYWNKRCNEWAINFNDKFNIMCESKMKNDASIKFYKEII